MKQPNIVLIICDQMRGDAFGADGNNYVQTPYMDYLASCGTRFKHAYSPVSSCLPARASLWSGQNQWHTGVLGMGKDQASIPNDFPHTLAGELTNAGYRTHLVGKGHFEPQRALMGFETTELDESGRTLTKGFNDEYIEWFRQNAPSSITPDDHGVDRNSWMARPWHTKEYLHPTAWTVMRAIEFLKQHNESQPFFLNISFARPHSPYVPPQPYFDMYINKPTPPPHLGAWSVWHDDPQEAANPNAWRGKMTPDQIHRARVGYYGEISFIDAQIGRCMNWMWRLRNKMYKNTWFVFTSDHGDMQGDHNLWRKTYAYEGSSRIPLLVVPPPATDIAQYKVADEVVQLCDVMPTVLQAAGVPVPTTVNGQNLLPLMSGPAENWRSYIHGENSARYSDEQEMQFVTDGTRKFIWFPRLDREQFFDLEKDPGECNDLSGDSSRQEEIEMWRGYLMHELASRECGWIKDNKLYCPEGEQLVSPFKNIRWDGSSTIT